MGQYQDLEPIEPKSKDSDCAPKPPPPSAGGVKEPTAATSGVAEPAESPAKPVLAKGKDVIRDFRGERFSNDTHRSKSDPDARLARKGDVAAKLSYLGNALMENRSGLVVDGEVRLAAKDGGETSAAVAMVDRQEGDHEITLGADKGYDTKDFVEMCQFLKTVPHVAQHKNARRSSAVPDSVAATEEYAVSIRCRKRIEQVFGWIKLAGGIRQLKVRGKKAVSGMFLLALSAYNLVRMNHLMAKTA